MQKDEEDIKIPFFRYIFIAGILIIIVLALYFWNFGFYGFSNSQGDWGTFGDFIGGTLNPLLAFLSLIALLTTIKIQSQELKETRKEIKDSSTALQEQSKSIKIQIFENTFFNMIDVYSSIVSNLYLKEFKIAKSTFGKVTVKFLDNFIEINKNEATKERECIAQLLNILEAYLKLKLFVSYDKNLYDNFHNNYEDKIGHYFGFIYQILKFIKDEEESNTKFDSKKYAYLFRSLFSKSELTLLAYHCLGSIGGKKFKRLVEYFEFFEHLPIKKLNNKLVLEYDKSVFGRSDKWKKHIDSITSKN
jgi:uncharacterized membrane protein